MGKNTDKIKELEQKKVNIETDIELEEADIKRISQVCLKQGVTKKILDDFIKAETKLSNPDSDPESMAVEVGTVQDYIKAFGGFTDIEKLVDPIQAKASNEWELKIVNAELKELKSDANKTVQEIYQETAEKVEQDGHLYPVKLVSQATAKLKQYNAQIDSFMNSIESLPVNIDISWLCQKVEAFCRKINAAIALVRYKIVSALSKMFKQANVFQQVVDPIANFNPADIFSCLGWIKNVIKFFLGPYLIVIQFITDFMTYTPPLIAEAVKLAANAASVPVKLASKIDITVQTKKAQSSPAVSSAINSEVTGTTSSSAVSSVIEKDTNQELADLYKDSFNIKVEPITLGEVMGGGAQEPPKETESPTVAKKKELYEKEANNALKEEESIWQELVNQLKQVHNVDSGMWVTAFPEKLRKLEGSGWFMERITSGHVANVALTDREMAIKLFGKEKVETENYHFLPIDTSRYPVYHAVNVLDVAQNKNLILDRAKDKVRSYYLAVSNGDSTRETELSPYINFFKELNTRDEVNFVYSYIQKYGQAVQATVLAEAKVEETANQPAL